MHEPLLLLFSESELHSELILCHHQTPPRYFVISRQYEPNMKKATDQQKELLRYQPPAECVQLNSNISNSKSEYVQQSPSNLPCLQAILTSKKLVFVLFFWLVSISIVQKISLYLGSNHMLSPRHNSWLVSCLVSCVLPHTGNHCTSSMGIFHHFRWILPGKPSQALLAMPRGTLC